MSVQGPEAGISAIGLCRSYGDRQALEEVTFELAAGQSLALLGSNGAGKTTLLRILATLLRPSSGQVAVLGHELPRAAWAARGSVGLVAHEPLVYRDLTVSENLRFIAELYGASQERADKLLGQVELTGRRDDPAAELSKGMLQRLAVARALIGEPELLLLDEPRANLDPHAVAVLEPLIGRACAATRVLVTHDPEFALADADMVLGLRNGQMQFFSQTSQVTDAELGRLYA